MSINSKMTAIADAIREHTGGTEKLGLAAMAANVPRVYDAGVQAEADRWGAEHFKTSFFGSGTRVLTIPMPFEPDLILVYAMNHYTEVSANTFRLVFADLRSAGRLIGGVEYCTPGGSIGKSSLITAAYRERFTYADGVLRFELASTAIPTVVWKPNVRYFVTAAKYNQDVKLLIEEEIKNLPDNESGTMTYVQSIISQYFTDTEWATLIVEKPNWTFAMV